jgi:hypothetical protein
MLAAMKPGVCAILNSVLVKRIEQPVHQKRTQSHLLQQTSVASSLGFGNNQAEADCASPPRSQRPALRRSPHPHNFFEQIHGL